MVYSGQVPETLRRHWLKEVGDHLICQLELLRDGRIEVVIEESIPQPSNNLVG